MQVSVAFEYPIIHTPPKARSKKTVMVQGTAMIDLPEAKAFQTPDAIKGVFIPKREYIGGVNPDDSIRLHGHNERLWRDCWDFSNRRFQEILSFRLYGFKQPQWNKRDKAADELRGKWASRTGFAEPKLGFLHWIDKTHNGGWDYREKDRKRCLVIKRKDAEIFDLPLGDTVHGVINSNGYEDALAKTKSYVAEKFLWVDGKIYENVPPPVMRVRKYGSAVRSIDRELRSGRTGSAYFRLDESEASEAFQRQMSNGRGKIDTAWDSYLRFEAENLDSRYLGFDRTATVIDSLCASLDEFSTMNFHLLSDDAIEAWISLRHAAAGWSPDEGDPRAVLAAAEAFSQTINPEAIGVKEFFDNITGACCAQAPMLDLSPRLRAVTDPDLIDLVF